MLRALAAFALLGSPVFDATPYRSPYTLKFSNDRAELIRDLEETDRGAADAQAVVPRCEWYSAKVKAKYGAWGPAAKHYPEAEIARDKSAEWKRERVIAAAMRFEGYEYQHHHVPAWDPPADWPWLTVQAGRSGKGVDCSNFTAFVYNQALDIKPTGAIVEQGEQTELKGPGGTTHTARRIDLPDDRTKLADTLRPGDLLFIRGKQGGKITHVVIWVGDIGKSPDGVPLVLDSHGEGVKDANGELIPAGVHLRPFTAKSWYARCASHALRIIE